MENSFLKKTKTYLPYFLLILVIVLPWFLKSGYLFLTDMAWGPNILIPDFTSTGHFYLHFLTKILNFVLPSDLIQKLFMVAVFGLILFGGYKIAQSLTQNNLVLFLGSAFALFNPFVYDRVMYGQVGTVLAYGFFLAALGCLLSVYLKNLSRRQLFLSSVFAGFSILFSPHFVFFLGLIYFIFGILILDKNWVSKDILLKLAKSFLLSVLIIGVINFNWLCGAFFVRERSIGGEVTAQDLETFKTTGTTQFETIENVLLMSGFWGMVQYRYESLKNIRENWGRSFYFLLPIIVLGLISNFKEKRKLIIALIFTFVTAFVLALGVALPLASKMTLWLFNNIPFYKGLREPQKWVAVIVAVYEVLLVWGLIELFKKKIVIKNKELVTALLAFIIFLQAPLLAWGGAGQVKPVNYPQDWSEVNDFIIKETGCQSKILFLPWHLYMSFKWIGSIVANPSSKFFQCPVIYGKNMEFGKIYSQSLDLNDRMMEEWLFSSGRTHLLQENELNIGYIILAKEVDWQNYLWIGNHPNVEFVKETENLRLYRVKKYEAK